ncbi:MAG: prepilin-type N-terminal cleavage/methylation domain-containing protein [Lactimicrobium massiliense]|nr:prepilin-type N-terminal cleavage/methylation domain-containing protein [Lactimicrobium massiliense]MDD6674793.1 prepilin-type N-terminal cleavage/methylation domain-containing protein [Lactimicrobium massiliense]
MNNSRKKKGFTLAELLIVVAIIGVLVAISIPIFTSQLEKAREATDLANVRSAYAEISAAALSEDAAPTDTTNIDFDRTGSENAYVYTAVVKLTQKENGWKTANGDKAVAGVTAIGSPTAGGTATVTVTEATGATTIEYK